jgi:hypothetical protein
MAHVFSTKIVVTRKKHRCNACCRLFPEGTKMSVQRIANEGTIYSWYACETCDKLMGKFPDMFDDGYGEFESGCVDNYLNKNQTPEELLYELTMEKLNM